MPHPTKKNYYHLINIAELDAMMKGISLSFKMENCVITKLKWIHFLCFNGRNQ